MAVRARDLGIGFPGTPGPLNGITDVSGVLVGHTTLIQGEDVRTGVTAILPRGHEDPSPCFAGWFSLNGNGEMTGTTWIEEFGLMSGPVCITNTHSVGIVRDAVIRWQLARGQVGDWSLPVVAETWDGHLNDINSFHVTAEHTFSALDSAHGGLVEEGSVGGGTGMICYEFKGGIGTSSRAVQDHTVGVLVQANFGRRPQLRILGVPVGDLLNENLVVKEESGSIIIVVATDAPLLPHHLKALAKRATLGLGRTGSVAGLSSGDIFLAFSTANSVDTSERHSLSVVGSKELTPLYQGVVEATEEAIINAMVAADTMTGLGGKTVYGIPRERLAQLFER